MLYVVHTCPVWVTLSGSLRAAETVRSLHDGFSHCARLNVSAAALVEIRPATNLTAMVDILIEAHQIDHVILSHVLATVQ